MPDITCIAKNKKVVDRNIIRPYREMMVLNDVVMVYNNVVYVVPGENAPQ